MKTLTFALATVLTTASAAYAGGPKTFTDGTPFAVGAAVLAAFLALNVALHYRRK